MAKTARSAAKGKARKMRGGTTRPMTSNMSGAVLQHNVTNYRQMTERTFREKGTDFIGTVTVQGTSGLATVSNRILNTIKVEPSAFPGTRLSVMAGLYERYRFRKFNLRYVPAVANTLACQLLWYYDSDPNDDPSTITDADALIRQALAHTGGQQWNFNTPKTNSLPQRKDDQWYYTGSKPGDNSRFTTQAIGRLVQVTNFSNFNGDMPENGIQCGSLYIDWEVDMQLPQIDAELISRSLPEVPSVETATKKKDVLVNFRTTDSRVAPIATVTAGRVNAYLCIDYIGILPTSGTGTTDVKIVIYDGPNDTDPELYDYELGKRDGGLAFGPLSNVPSGVKPLVAGKSYLVTARVADDITETYTLTCDLRIYGSDANEISFA